MSNANDVRKAHDLLDELDARAELSQEQEKLLRSFLPELPKQKTLEELRHAVHAAWSGTHGNKWLDDVDGDLETWLYELHTQLKGLKDTPATVPALPAGMRIAEHEEYGRCVVSPNADENNLSFRIFYVDEVYVTDSYSRYVETSSLTFIDAEPAKPAHPEILETEADYSRAPRHTIVAHQGESPWEKLDDGMWITTGMDDMDEPVSSLRLGEISRRVLRWGDGK